MLKPNSLRAHLTAAIPELSVNPDKIVILVKNGNIAAAGAGSLSFEYRYTLNVIVLDYSSHADAIIVPLLAWLETHQIELFDNVELRDKAIRFEAEFLNKETVDLSIEIDLTERVIVAIADTAQTEVSSRYTITHVPEPDRIS